MEIYRKLFDLLSPQERKQTLLLLVMILVMAVLDAVGVASIMPFMAVLANSEVIQTNRWLAAIYGAFGFNETNAFLFFLGTCVFVALVTAIAFKALVTWMLLRFIHICDYAIGRRLVLNYLSQPYEWFLNRHSVDLGKSVLSEVSQVINGALIPAMHIIAHSVVVIALVGLLLAVDPLLTLAVVTGLGTAYGTNYFLMRRSLARLGAERVSSNQQRFRAVQEAFGGIKEVKVAGLESICLNNYDAPAQCFAYAQARSQLIAQIPRYLLEALAFGGMLLVLLYLMRVNGSLEEALPLITLYALAGYRLIPAIQQVYANLSRLRFSTPALESFHLEFTGIPAKTVLMQNEPGIDKEQMTLKKSISLRDVSYSYPKALRPTLDHVSIEIEARQTIGIIGATGSGKTTLIDLLLGLLQPQSGALEIDKTVITSDNLRTWQRSVGYVPQYIYLIDDTVMANIAFGIPRQSIDVDSVICAAKIANLHDFVINELPEGYATTVGERGVRLSGGQRQRIGIARALYHDPAVLIMDEATSALDNLTEQAVMEAVDNLAHRKTIILIAHRLSTVKNCDCIFVLDHGKVSGKGNYDELLDNNHQFRLMAKAYENA